MTSRRMLPFAVLVAATAASAQTPAPKTPSAPAPSAYAIPIGSSIGLDAAKKAAAAASAEARKNNWFMAIAVVDPAGTLVYYEKADTTQLGSARVAIDKAKSAALYKRP
ncbi:MAG TPA: heme-binding protein, partial [Myxococcales bacterium]|nr:heme-binding protein [Myxococcales bacterium]